MRDRRSARIKRLAKRNGCIPHTRSSCGRAAGCTTRPNYVSSYTVKSGKYANTKRDHYCRKTF